MIEMYINSLIPQPQILLTSKAIHSLACVYLGDLNGGPTGNEVPNASPG